LFEPQDSDLRERAATLFDDSIERLRGIPEVGEGATLRDNLHFRLARALADRAALEPVGSTERRPRESDAFELMQKQPEEPGLAGYWHLLRADLARRLGKPEEAGKELDAARKTRPAPPETEVFDAEIPYLIERKRFAEAGKALGSSRLEQQVRQLWMVRV